MEVFWSNIETKVCVGHQFTEYIKRRNEVTKYGGFGSVEGYEEQGQLPLLYEGPTY